MQLTHTKSVRRDQMSLRVFQTRTWLPSSDAAEVVPQTFDKSTVPLSQGERLYVSKECARDTSIDGDWTFKQKEV